MPQKAKWVDKPTENQIRISPDAKAILEEVIAMSDIPKAMKLLSSLFDLGKRYVEIYKVSKFNQTTGRPVEHEWRPHEGWNGILSIFDNKVFSWQGGSDNSNPQLLKSLNQNLPQGELMVVGNLVIEHVPDEDACDCSEGHHIRLKKALLVIK